MNTTMNRPSIADKIGIAVSVAILALAWGTVLVYAALPQFPNVFYGNATVFDFQSQEWSKAAEGMVVTAVVDRGLGTERHYVLPVTTVGKYGSGNGLKLKVGGDLQGDIADNALIEFYVSYETLPFNPTAWLTAGSAVFHADGDPHVTKFNLYGIVNWP